MKLFETFKSKYVKVDLFESKKYWFNNKKKWETERNKLNVSDDDINWSKDDKEQLIAFWYDDREEGWIIK